jgi:hypothetical protein
MRYAKGSSLVDEEVAQTTFCYRGDWVEGRVLRAVCTSDSRRYLSTVITVNGVRVWSTTPMVTVTVHYEMDQRVIIGDLMFGLRIVRSDLDTKHFLESPDSQSWR